MNILSCALFLITNSIIHPPCEVIMLDPSMTEGGDGDNTAQENV
jgi:hypothetical protein